MKLVIVSSFFTALSAFAPITKKLSPVTNSAVSEYANEIGVTEPVSLIETRAGSSNCAFYWLIVLQLTIDFRHAECSLDSLILLVFWMMPLQNDSTAFVKWNSNTVVFPCWQLSDT